MQCITSLLPFNLFRTRKAILGSHPDGLYSVPVLAPVLGTHAVRFQAGLFPYDGPCGDGSGTVGGVAVLGSSSTWMGVLCEDSCPADHVDQSWKDLMLVAEVYHQWMVCYHWTKKGISKKENLIPKQLNNSIKAHCLQDFCTVSFNAQKAKEGLTT